MMYGLPTGVDVAGEKYDIRSDYRAVLDICTALSDPELSGREKAFAALFIFYPEYDQIPIDCLDEALFECYKFIDCGEEEKEERKQPRLIDWEQDYRYIVPPINRVLGKEIRQEEYLHWWSFVSAYYEIGECTLAQIVRVRDHLARGKALDKADKEWYQRNRGIAELKTKYTAQDDDVLNQWIK